MDPNEIIAIICVHSKFEEAILTALEVDMNWLCGSALDNCNFVEVQDDSVVEKKYPMLF